MKDNKKVFSGVIWRFGQVFGAQAVSLIVSIILARLLEPEVYGTIALVTVIVTVLQVFVDSGLGVSLVQKKDSDELDFSSVFYFNLAMCAVLYILIFLAAPYIARFYEIEELCGVVRVISLTLIIYGVKGIQQTYVAKHYLFKKMFLATLIGNLGGAAVGIAMAYLGFGVWALVAQSLVNAGLDTLLLWIMIEWRPRAMFSFTRLRTLLAYGWKLLASNLLETLYNNLCALIIGKKYSEESLAFYNRGRQFPNLSAYIVNSSVDYVVFAAIAEEQNDRERVLAMTRRSVGISSYLMWPVTVGMAACAEPFVRVLLTDKWLPCVPYMRLFCLIYAFYPVYTATLNAIKAVGRSDMFLWLELSRKFIGLGLIILSVRYGIMAMVIAELAASLISMAINSVPSKKLLDYGLVSQLGDILPSMLLSFFMGFCVWSVQLLGLSDILTLFVQIVLGVAVYTVMSALFRLDSFRYLLGVAKRLVKRSA